MGTLVVDDVDIVVNSIDLSDHLKAIDLRRLAEMLDDTVMGDNTRSRKAGLKDNPLNVRFVMDFASGSVDATLAAALGIAAFTITMKPTSASVGANNPSYVGLFVLESYEAISGEIGALMECNAVFQAAGDLVRTAA